MKKLLLVTFIGLNLVAGVRAEEPITIGLLVSLSGPYADIGEDCRRGIETSRQMYAPDDRVGSHTLRFIYEDSQADPKVGVNAFKKLADEDRALAVVTMRSPIGMAVNPLSRQVHVPVLGGVGHKDFVSTNEYAFQHWPSTQKEGAVLADEIIRTHPKGIGVITAEDEWTMALTAGFKDRFIEKNGTIELAETVPPGEMDLGSLLTRAKRDVPGALFLNLGLAQGAATLRRAREVGYPGTIYSNFWAGDSKAIEAAGPATEGLLFPETKLELPKFKATLSKSFSPKRPSAMTFSCYAATAMVIQALKNITAIPNRENLYQELLSIKNIELLDEPLPMKDRRAEIAVVMKRIKNNAVQESW